MRIGNCEYALCHRWRSTGKLLPLICVLGSVEAFAPCLDRMCREVVQGAQRTEKIDGIFSFLVELVIGSHITNPYTSNPSSRSLPASRGAQAGSNASIRPHILRRYGSRHPRAPGVLSDCRRKSKYELVRQAPVARQPHPRNRGNLA